MTLSKHKSRLVPPCTQLVKRLMNTGQRHPPPAVRVRVRLTCGCQRGVRGAASLEFSAPQQSAGYSVCQAGVRRLRAAGLGCHTEPLLPQSRGDVTRLCLPQFPLSYDDAPASRLCMVVCKCTCRCTGVCMYICMYVCMCINLCP